jgi:CelD/BcsL family acetyltransferase involved in cellulose biosynthesis
VFLAMNSFAQDKYARLAPGEMTLFHMIEDTANRGLERFDFGIGDARYKRSWCDREIPLYETIIPLTATGSAAAGVISLVRRGTDAIRANPRLHKLAQRLRRSGSGEPEARSAGDDDD